MKSPECKGKTCKWYVKTKLDPEGTLVFCSFPPMFPVRDYESYNGCALFEKKSKEPILEKKEISKIMSDDINTAEWWLDMIKNNTATNGHEKFLIAAALAATSEQLEHLRTAYPNLVETVKEYREY